MIDFHSHIVYDVDDGSDTIENSIKILKEAKKAGFNKILLTPHYMQDYYEFPANEIRERIEILQEKCEEENINIELYQANEIYINNNIVELLDEQVASTMNNSRYVLIETPMSEEPPNLLEVIYQLLENGKIPVVAHPERYSYVQKNPNKLIELIDNGVLFQSNYGSILGQYGKEVEKTVKLLLENNFIHFLGTDVHKQGNIYMRMDEVESKLRKIISEEKIEELTTINPQKVIDDDDIYINEPSEIKQGFFEKIFHK